MANRPAPALLLRDGDRAELERWTRSDRFGASAAKRARIVLLASDGVANARIAELTDATVTTVLNWRGRYHDRGVAGLRDAPRPGRPRTLDHRQIVAETLKPPPRKLVLRSSRRPTVQQLQIRGTSSVAATQLAEPWPSHHDVAEAAYWLDASTPQRGERRIAAALKTCGAVYRQLGNSLDGRQCNPWTHSSTTSSPVTGTDFRAAEARAISPDARRGTVQADWS
jgi:hypothetical protein